MTLQFIEDIKSLIIWIRIWNIQRRENALNKQIAAQYNPLTPRKYFAEPREMRIFLLVKAFEGVITLTNPVKDYSDNHEEQ